MYVSDSFLKLQLAFAKQVVACSELTLEQALMHYTNLYIRLGLGRDFNPQNPIWTQFLQGLLNAEDDFKWLCDTYRSRLTTDSSPPLSAQFGCFAYAYHADQALIRIHFQYPRPHDIQNSLLGKTNLSQRQSEMQKMRQDMKAHYAPETKIQGCSWLYNLKNYQDLFSTPYLKSLETKAPRFHSMTLWGQILQRNGELHTESALTFKQKLKHVRCLADLEHCFELPVWGAHTQLAKF